MPLDSDVANADAKLHVEFYHHKERFPRQWLHFQMQNENGDIPGTKLEEWHAAAPGDISDAQMAELQKSMTSAIDGALKNAPAGTENAVTLVKSAMSAANNAYESVHKAAKQAAEVAEANFQAVTTTAVKATQAASKGKRAA